MAKTLQNRTEESIVRDSFHRISKKKSIQACCQVPILGRSVDLIYIVDERLIAVEFKLFAWRKALEQSFDHKLGADFAYICMLRRKITNDMKEEFQKAGVGLVFYRDNGRWPFDLIIRAPKSKEIWPVARSRVTSYIRDMQKVEVHVKQTA